METSHHGFIIMLLVIFLLSGSAFASKIINSSNDTISIEIHSDRKRILQAIRPHPKPNPSPGLLPTCNEYPLCMFEENGAPGYKIECRYGYVISQIIFADYGKPDGTRFCEFKRGPCGSPNALSVVKKECIGVTRCDLSRKPFAPHNCNFKPYPNVPRFAMTAVCKKKT